MNVICGANPCPILLSSACVFYEGENLLYTGISTNDSIQTALQKIDNKFQDAAIGYAFLNGVIQTAPGQPVKLGGSLTQNTVITSGGYTFEFTGTLRSSAFITSGGTSTQFVKGDGSLDSGPYQPAGNYITALTGDGTASGPGSALFTLATVNSAPGVYGSSTVVPRITVNAKGLVTNVVPVSIPTPSDVIILQGDVTGVGNTGAPVNTTLATVNATPFGGNTLLKFGVNGKGLVTSAAPITALDLAGILGYTPVPTTRTLTINGVTYNLNANRTWSVGTVTNVSVVTLGGISASVANPNSTPVLSLTNTAPDQIVSLTPGLGIAITGTYPNFNIANTGNGSVVSVGLSMPSAFNVANSPITTTGTFNVTGAGLVSQYIRGDGTLADLPNFGGGGASVNYYLNGSVNQGVFGGDTYYELSRTAVIGSPADFTISADGYIAEFLTDAGEPGLLDIPSGNWKIQAYFSASSAGGSPNFHVELYKYDGVTFTLIASSASTPEPIAGGTAIELHNVSMAVPATSLSLTDRLAIRIYVNHSGKTITLYTQDNRLAEILTTFTSGLVSINSLTEQLQFLSVGTSGTDFNIASAVDTHTFNLPVASATNTGKLSSSDWSTFSAKQNALTFGDLTEATSSVLTITGGVGAVIGTGTSIQVDQASSTTDGYVSSADWNKFNTNATAGNLFNYYNFI